MLGVQDIYALRHKVLVEGKSQRQVARDASGMRRVTMSGRPGPIWRIPLAVGAAFAALVLVGCESLFPDVEDWIADSETLARRFDARLGDLQELRVETDRSARESESAWRRTIAARCSTRRRASSPCARGWGRAASLHRSASRRRSGRGSTGSVRVWKGCWRCRALTRFGASRSCGWRRTGSARESETTLNPGSGKRRNGAKARNEEPNEEQQPQPAPREQERQGEPARVSGRVA